MKNQKQQIQRDQRCKNSFILYKMLPVIIILLFILQPLQAQSENNSDDSRAELVERLDSLIRAAAEKPWVAGMSVAVLKGNDTLLLKGYGMADVGLWIKKEFPIFRNCRIMMSILSENCASMSLICYTSMA